MMGRAVQTPAPSRMESEESPLLTPLGAPSPRRVAAAQPTTPYSLAAAEAAVHSVGLAPAREPELAQPAGSRREVPVSPVCSHQSAPELLLLRCKPNSARVLPPAEPWRDRREKSSDSRDN